MERKAGKHKQHVSNDVLYNKRRHPRANVQGYVGDIADGNFVLAGTVEDISSGGFRMSSLPQSFSASNQNYTTVISGRGKHYRLIVAPCWKKQAADSRSVEVGFKIVQASWEWSELILDTVSSRSLDAETGFQA